MAFTDDEDGQKKDISLRNEFDTVVRCGDTTIELNTNGSVVVNNRGRTITCTNRDVTIRLPANDAKTGEKIMSLAAAEARKYGHATITFNHLLSAVLQKMPEQVETIFAPKLKAASLLAMIDKDLRDATYHPQTLLPGSTFDFSGTASAALSETRDAVKKWNSDRLFGAELIHSMIKAGRLNPRERSTTLDYIAMIASEHCTLTAATEVRAMINKYAVASGDTPVRIIRYDLEQS